MTARLCPICQGEMARGELRPPSGAAVFWMPEAPAKRTTGMFTPQRVADCGGIVLGEAVSLGFLAKTRPRTYYCKACKMFFTPTEEE